MNKAELIEAIATKTECSKKDVTAVINSLQDVITDALKANDKVQLVGFGTFEASNRDARDCRNPITGETVHVEAKRVPKFKASGPLKKALL